MYNAVLTLRLARESREGLNRSWVPTPLFAQVLSTESAPEWSLAITPRTVPRWETITEQYRIYTPRFNEVERGVYWYHLVRLSVCGQNRVRSVSSTILIGSISYLHILSSDFRRCVACNACFKIQKFNILAIFYKFVTLTLSSFDLGSNMTQWYG